MSAPRWRPAYIGIGSNLDSPSEQVERGIAALAEITATILVLQSCLYRSAPLGPNDQPDFINAVAAIMTQLKPLALLAELQSIEELRGRTRDGQRWGPRILDLDLLSFAGITLFDTVLTLPHPGITDRNFVLLPWSDITPHYKIPGLSSVAALARSVNHLLPKIEKLS